MAITNLERRIRLSNFTPTDYDMISYNYRQQLLPILMESREFVTALESKESYVVPRKKLETEVSKLAAHSDPAISSCGKAILQFMVGRRCIYRDNQRYPCWWNHFDYMHDRNYLVSFLRRHRGSCRNSYQGA